MIVVEKIIPCPIEHDNDAVAKADDAVNVQEDPDYPGNEAAEGDAKDAGDGGVPSHRGEQTGVFIVERFGLFPFHHETNILRRGLTLLDRHGRKHGREKKRHRSQRLQETEAGSTLG